MLPALTVLPFDVATARAFGELTADVPAMDLTTRELQVAATALYHGLAIVTSPMTAPDRSSNDGAGTVHDFARQVDWLPE